MMGNTQNWDEVNPLRYWCQKVLPAVYDESLSYYEQVCKVSSKLNELINVYNEIPAYIEQLIKDLITDDKLKQLISELMTDLIINVKYPPAGIPPAKGDGTVNDGATIQACIDYAASLHGAVVYFPSGSYLSTPLNLKSNVSLLGSDRNTTKIVLQGGARAPLLTGSAVDSSIKGLMFDGNGDIQTENINLMDITSANVVLEDLKLTDGYILLNITNSDLTQITNVDFGWAIQQHLNISGWGSIQANNLFFRELSPLKGRCIIQNSMNSILLSNVMSVAQTPTFLINSGNNIKIDGHVLNAVNLMQDTGTGNSYEITPNLFEKSYNRIGLNGAVNVNGDLNENGNLYVSGSTDLLGETMAHGNLVAQGDEFKINTVQPFQYNKNPQWLSDQFNYIPAKNNDGNQYKILVESEGTKSINTNPYNGKKIAVIGDSLAAGFGWWLDEKDRNIYNDGIFPYLRQNIYNVTIDNFAKNGSTLCTNADLNLDILTQYNSIGTGYNVLIIDGGNNDIFRFVENVGEKDVIGNLALQGTNDTTLGNLNKILENAVNKFEKVIFWQPVFDSNINLHYSTNDLITLMCRKYGVQVIKDTGIIPNHQDNTKYYHDDLHYNNIGYNKAAQHFLESMVTQESDYRLHNNVIVVKGNLDATVWDNNVWVSSYSTIAKSVLQKYGNSFYHNAPPLIQYYVNSTSFNYLSLEGFISKDIANIIIGEGNGIRRTSFYSNPYRTPSFQAISIPVNYTAEMSMDIFSNINWTGTTTFPAALVTPEMKALLNGHYTEGNNIIVTSTIAQGYFQYTISDSYSGYTAYYNYNVFVYAYEPNPPTPQIRDSLFDFNVVGPTQMNESQMSATLKGQLSQVGITGSTTLIIDTLFAYGDVKTWMVIDINTFDMYMYRTYSPNDLLYIGKIIHTTA